MSNMDYIAALKVLNEVRTDEIVITTMGSAREWPRISNHPLDFHYIPSAMGQAPSLGLGIALAKPTRQVWVLNGDGAMLMNLGCLVTVIASGATNVTVFVLENQIYEVTGGQRTPAGTLGPKIDLAGFARAAGFPVVARFECLDDWRGQAAQLLRQSGPRFVVLAVEPVGEDYLLESPGPLPQRLAKFKQALIEIE
ncbi:MAG TPA: thiamine pyrophosphate-dependent enzyme [Pirellulales bacterium]|jgi:thiamine pyrophosphate-dependent acetolactate synthase large subunit-like protein